MNFDLFPEVPMPKLPATWDDLNALADYDPIVRDAMVMVRLGRCTREQALIAVVFASYDARRRMFKLAMDLRNCMPTPPFIIPSQGAK